MIAPYHSHKISDISAHQSSNWNLSLIAPYHNDKISDIPSHQSSNWNLSPIEPYHSHKISDIPAHVRPYNCHMTNFLTFELIINIFLDIICWGDLLNL